MNSKHKEYNIIMALLAIIGLVLIVVSFFVKDKQIENLLEWPGFIMFWSAVLMKFLHPKLSRSGRSKIG